MKSQSTTQRHTFPVDDEVFKQVYDSPAIGDLKKVILKMQGKGG